MQHIKGFAVMQYSNSLSTSLEFTYHTWSLLNCFGLVKAHVLQTYTDRLLINRLSLMRSAANP